MNTRFGNLTTPYLQWLADTVTQYDTDATGSGDSWQPGYEYTWTPRPGSTPESELAKYNREDRTIDPAWGATFLYLNNYYREGQFAPGAPTATLEVMAQANAQWARDSAPGMLDKVVQAAALAVLAYTGYTIATGGFAAAGSMSSYAVPTTMAEEMAMLGVPVTSETAGIAAIVDAAPLVDYGGYAFDPVAVTSPETVTAAAKVAAGTATPADVATVAKTGLTATEVLGTAKTVLGAASTVVTIAKMATGATKINPATGAPYGLPPGYQPTVTPDGTPTGTPVNYGNILKQLALPIGGLLAVYLLKG